MRKLGTTILWALLGVAPPLLLQAQSTETYDFTTNRLVPDGNPSGLSDVRTISSAIGSITSVTVHLKITGEFNGDLYAYLKHAGGFVVLLNRPGTTASNPAGYADSGLDVTFQNGAPNGDIHLYQLVTTPATGLPLTGAWQPDERNVDPAIVTESSARSTALTSFNGLNAAGDWTLYLADLQSGGTNQVTEWSLAIVGQAYPTLTWTNPVAIVYGTALGGSQLNATATYNSTNVPGTLTYTPALGKVLNAGQGQTLSVTFTPTDTAAFLPITTNVTINVNPSPLTVTANDATKIYGAALPTFTASYRGFVNGDNAANLTTQATLNTTQTASSPVGTYPGAITASGAASPNYAFSYVAGMLTIRQSATAGSIVSSPNPALPGANVTFTMTVSPVAPGAGAPGGTVSFRIDGNIAGAGALSGGVAAFATTALAHGLHTVAAEYAGDPNFVGITNSLAPAQVINTPPVAGSVTIQRYPALGVKVSLSTLLASCSDADNDVLNITVSSTSASNATVTVANGWVFYAPATGYTNADSFTYTVTDGDGGSAVGTVTVAIEVDNSPGQNLTITSLGNGSFLINGNGIPGYTYRLQSSPTINPAAWQVIPGASVTAGSTGAIQYTNDPNGGTGFYRTVYP